jgi:hypothetical protein
MASAILVTLVGVDVPPLRSSGLSHVPSQHTTSRFAMSFQPSRKGLLARAQHALQGASA